MEIQISLNYFVTDVLIIYLCILIINLLFV